jgi:hypothetical protein
MPATTAVPSVNQPESIGLAMAALEGLLKIR